MWAFMKAPLEDVFGGYVVKKLYVGKTKDVYLRQDGNIVLRFKDSVTGFEGQIDPGGNEVLAEVAGKGGASLKSTLYFFDLLEKANIPTHFLGLGKAFGHGLDSIVVRRARMYHLEVICREKAWGSFVRRYGNYVDQGAPLPTLIEFTLKDDEGGDPLITEDALVALDIVSSKTLAHIKYVARKATDVIKQDLAQKGLELVDIKYEFGEVDGKSMIVDEISGDSMRVLKEGRLLLQKELYEEISKD